jgi:lipooligosaccharide transport system permease protein
MTAEASLPGPPASAPATFASAVDRIWRARKLVERNVMVYRHQMVVIFSGVLEPVLYLAGIGFGLGGLVSHGVSLPDGRSIPYATYAAPGLLAVAAMNGAVFETIFNVFFKLNYAKTYEGILATPMGITEIAVGEMLWALLRALLYATAMLLLMLVLGLILSPWALLALPAALLVSAAFSAAGLAGTSVLRTVQDFDIPMGLIVMPMFLFSGTFFPTSFYPVPIQVALQATPLFHSISLIRGLTLGVMGWEQVWDLAYLVTFFALLMWVAMRQMERKLIK